MDAAFSSLFYFFALPAMETVSRSIDQEEPHLTSAAQRAHNALEGHKSGQIRHTLVDMSFEHLGSLLIKPHTALRVSCCVVSTEQRRVISGHDPTLLQKPIAGQFVLTCFANTTTCCWPPVPGLSLQRHGQQTVDVSGAGPKQGGIVPAPDRWIGRQAEAACGECGLINKLLKCSNATPGAGAGLPSQFQQLG